ncbi:MAG: PDZ domain-containing protein, partial [Planctomycetota bacterium]
MDLKDFFSTISISISFFFLGHSPTKIWAQERRIWQRITPAIVGIREPVGLKQELEELKAGKRIAHYGSGVIIHPEGWILTSLSIINKASQVEVILSPSLVLQGKVVGKDRNLQIALIKISGKDYPFIPFGNSRTVRIGNAVALLSNTYHSLSRNRQVTITTGVISSKHLITGEQSPYHGTFWETTAAINPGSFGGALVNGKGELVALALPLLSKRTWLGGGVPVHQIQLVLPYLKKGIQPPQGRLGISVVQPGLISPKKEVMVDEVDPKGPAAGILQKGDRLVQIDGFPIHSLHDLDKVL